MIQSIQPILSQYNVTGDIILYRDSELLDLSNRRYVKTLKLPKNISKNPIDL